MWVESVVGKPNVFVFCQFLNLVFAFTLIILKHDS